MSASFVKFLSAFIPIRKVRQRLRSWCYLVASRKCNRINIRTNNKVECKIRVDGRDNNIQLELKGRSRAIVDITVYGNNNEIIIGEDVSIAQKLKIVIGQHHPNFGKVSNCKIYIGARTSFESCTLITYNSGAEIHIGSECMFSSGITIYQTDGHPIIDRQSGRIINTVRAMCIGNHVWVGAGVTILKNSYIADDTIIGMSSVVAGEFRRPYCAIAGNPARVVTKEGCEIMWRHGDPDYISNGIDYGEKV